MNIIDVVSKIDLDMLKEQGQTVEGIIEQIDAELKHGSVEFEYTERLAIDKNNLEGLLELIDNLVIGLEEV